MPLSLTIHTRTLQCDTANTPPVSTCIHPLPQRVGPAWGRSSWRRRPLEFSFRANAASPAQARLLAAVVKGPCFKADELPPVPDKARKPPTRSAAAHLFGEAEEDE